tara:strand:+ start:17 stop:355 length:339 start_codon:yes stop_codon:yes gene_type:complete
MSVSYRSYLKGIKIAPRKVRLVVDLVRGKAVQDALDILKYMNNRSAPQLAKLIQSAVANARQKATVDVDNLVIQEAFVDEGPMMKRFLPRAQGRATPILKRSSHVTIKVTER